MTQTRDDTADLARVLDTLCPMYVILDPTGHIRHAGATLQKLHAEKALVGRRFMEVFELNRPRSITTMSALLSVGRVKLHLQFRAAPRTGLKGVLAPSPEPGGAIINLSFGISILDGVRDFALTSADFAATDLTIEMLYLVEAKSAAMEASRSLNLRLQGAMIAAEEQAFTDTLTGLKNRRALDHVLSRLLESGESFALMQLDLDFFKAVNDTLGHAAGDHVLQEVARIMINGTRSEETIARVGGDEFVLLFPGLTDHVTLERVAQRIIAQLEVPIPFNGAMCKISASMGTVLSSDYETPTSEEMFADADVALYASKHAGRACHSFYVKDLRRKAQNMAPPVGREMPLKDAR